MYYPAEFFQKATLRYKIGIGAHERISNIIIILSSNLFFAKTSNKLRIYGQKKHLHTKYFATLKIIERLKVTNGPIETCIGSTNCAKILKT